MKNHDKTREQLLKDLEKSKKRIAELEKSETERKQVEEQIRFFSSVVEQSADGMAIADMEGNLLFVNNAWASMHGYEEPNELIGQNLSIFHNKEQLEKDVEPFNREVKENGYYKGEVGHIRRDGTIFPTQMTTTLLRDENDNPIAISGVATDITERKRVEEAIKTSEERLKILFESAPDAYYLSDLKGTFIDGNKAAEVLMGYKKEELVEKNFLKLKLLSANELLKASKLLVKNIQGKSTGPDEFILNRKDGSQIPVEISTHPVKIKNKTVVLGIARDITEHKQAEKALRESEYLLRESQKIAALGSYVLDIPTGIWKSSSILDDIFGIDKEYNKDVSGWVQIIHPEDQAMMQDYFAINVVTNHESFNKEYRIKRINDRQERWVHGMGELEFNDDGNPGKMVGTIKDITERKKVEEELAKHREHLEELVKERTAELEEKNKELKRYNKLFEGREFRIKELRDRVKELEKKVSR